MKLQWEISVQMSDDNVQAFKIQRVKVYPSRLQFLLDRCRGKDILHLGCTNEGHTDTLNAGGSLLHSRLIQVSKHVTGVDIDSTGIFKMRALNIEDVYVGDVEHLQEMTELADKRFDLVIAGEIVEHLNNPGLALQGVKGLLRPGGRLIITVPSAFSFAIVWRTLTRYEYVNFDHNYYFSGKTLSTLLKKNGYEIHELATYTLQPNKSKSWSRRLRRKLTRTCVYRPLYWLNPFFADGIICDAYPATCVRGTPNPLVASHLQ